MDKQRNYDDILTELASMKKTIRDIRSHAQGLKSKGGTAQSTLSDVIGGKVSQSVITMAEDVLDAVADGEERIRQLEYRVQEDKDQFERLKAMAQSLDEGR